MFNTQVPTGPVKLFHRLGGQYVYASRSAALAALGKSFLRDEVGTAFPDFLPPNPFRAPMHVQWRMEGVAGRALTYQDFAELISVRPDYWARRWGNYSGVGPVPGTAKRKAGARMFRSPTTQQERRQAAFWDKEAGEPRPRAKRASAVLPSSWDDHRIAADEDRSWKLQRRHQYR